MRTDPHGALDPMLAAHELARLCERLGLSAEATAVIESIRASPPARRVRSAAGNVSVCYPSRKMGVTIQAESHHVELAALYEYEHDPRTLEFYDQPPPIKLVYTSKDWLAKHTDLATKAATALSRGNNYVLQHPAEAIALLQKDFASVPPQIIEESMREVILPQIPKDGKMSEEMWTATNTILFESGMLKQLLDIKEGALRTNQYIGDASVP